MRSKDEKKRAKLSSPLAKEGPHVFKFLSILAERDPTDNGRGEEAKGFGRFEAGTLSHSVER